MPQQVLSFWFEELQPQQWFRGGEAVDAMVRDRFAAPLEQAAAGELEHWRDTVQGRLAEIIVLDQFSRNMHRGTPAAFAMDPVALVLSQEAVRSGALAGLDSATQRGFLLMPYMHSESRHIHGQAVPLFREYATEVEYRYEIEHKAIIDRFGRYPHRNAILQRVSTPEELEFLQQPGSGF